MADTPDNLPPIGQFPAIPVAVDTEHGPTMAQFGYTKDDKKQVLVYFELLAGSHAGTRLPWFGWFGKDSWERTLESLRIAGWKSNNIADCAKELDQEVNVTVGHNSYDGKTYARVDWVNKPGGGTIQLQKPMNANELRQFAAFVSGYAKNIPPVDGKKASMARSTHAGGAEQQPGREGATTQPMRPATPARGGFDARPNPGDNRGGGFDAPSGAGDGFGGTEDRGRQPGGDDDIPF